MPASSMFVDAITRAALDPAAWADVTTIMSREHPGTCAVMVGYDLSMRHSFTEVAAGYDPDCMAAYRAHFARTNPYQPTWDDLAPGRFLRSEELIPEADLLRTEFWTDWLRPQDDLRHARASVLARDPGRLFLFNCHIAHRAMPQVGHRVEETLQEAMPLLRRSLEINRLLMGLRLDATVLRFGLEPEDAAIFVLGPRGSILYANAQGLRRLHEGDLVRHDGRGRLRAVPPVLAARLQAALRGVARLGELNARAETSEGPVEVHLLPLGEGVSAKLDSPILLGLPAPALLVAMRPVARHCALEVRLRERLGLTPAEAAVAVALADGQTIAEIAEARGVSRLTVRHQVGRALEKAGARRQADLVARVVDLRGRR